MDKVTRAILNIGADEVSSAASTLMTKAQMMRPHRAVAGSAAAFLLIAEAFDVSPRKALEVAGRALRDASKTEKGSVQIGAIQDLMANELSNV